MNNHKVREILNVYKRNFKRIHNEEIYKWRAVKCFQDNWDINATDFLTMLDNSFAGAKNLLDSGKYFPKRMLQAYTAKEPDTVRQLFINLYKEDEDLINRIESFQAGIIAIHDNNFRVKNHYQDHRAVLVYLCLRYPDRYYLFKFTMFKAFVGLVDYLFKPKTGEVQTVLEYLSLCDIIRAEIIKDTKLLELHKTRIKEKEYIDSACHILTQDIIYAAVQNFDKFNQGEKQEPALTRLIKVDRPISPKADTIVFKGSFTNYIENEKEKKRIGDLGELLVLQYEQEKLISLGIDKTPEHKSKSEGDGLGYDILSFDECGEEMFIEVKTTSKHVDTPFYITRNELERSKQSSNNFFLYRLYEFDDTENKAKYYKQKGDLAELCVNPILYRAIVADGVLS